MVGNHCYVIMGISSCGKSTVGSCLATALGVPFHEGDAYHPPHNVDKMKQGIPLDDRDRQPWLMSLHHLVRDAFASSSTCVISCSALKKEYRMAIEGSSSSVPKGFVRFVWLDIDPDLAIERCTQRSAHFFPASLVDSQFEILDMTKDESFCYIKVHGGHQEKTTDAIVTQILHCIDTH